MRRFVGYTAALALMIILGWLLPLTGQTPPPTLAARKCGPPSPDNPCDLLSRTVYVWSVTGNTFGITENAAGLQNAFNFNTATSLSGASLGSNSQIPSQSSQPVAVRESQLRKGLTPTDAEYYCRSILFATDRRVTGFCDPSNFFSGHPDASPTEAMSYGACEVALPIERKIGTMASPHIWKLEFKPDLRKHVVLLHVARTSREEFLAAASEISAESDANEALVFIHGFNVSFESAARRTAQIAHDLQFPGAAILYSWASLGRLDPHAYAHDLDSIGVTIPRLVSFLADLRNTGIKTIHVIAHSMGNQALTEALRRMETPSDTIPFRHIVLMAPDVNAIVFRDLAAAIRSKAERVTLYVSPRDKALSFSRWRSMYPRAGEVIQVYPGIDTIDASDVDTSLLCHSYFAGSRSILGDMFILFKHGHPPEKRFGLQICSSDGGNFYRFRA